jgi:hypothetical protein
MAKVSNPCLSEYLIIAGEKIIKRRKDINVRFDIISKKITDLIFR